ncbi:hypothetical protein HK105_208450 [Polyrhizophydium stewartii]|uniref:Uncharacterized protein n=1 Tax=Polyrhizophydium stewartii TaxID=2732419 RepID=A0ABR4MXT8_9FUNG
MSPPSAGTTMQSVSTPPSATQHIVTPEMSASRTETGFLTAPFSVSAQHPASSPSPSEAHAPPRGIPIAQIVDSASPGLGSFRASHAEETAVIALMGLCSASDHDDRSESAASAASNARASAQHATSSTGHLSTPHSPRSAQAPETVRAQAPFKLVHQGTAAIGELPAKHDDLSVPSKIRGIGHDGGTVIPASFATSSASSGVVSFHSLDAPHPIGSPSSSNGASMVPPARH